MNHGTTLFLLNPPGDISQDSVALEKATVRSILTALHGSTIHRVVAQSVQGARSGQGIGDLGVLYDMEQGLVEWGKPCRITRAGYYMSNWLMLADEVKNSGQLPSYFPTQFKLPTVSPTDLGVFNAQHMMKPFDGFKIHNFSGPVEYTPADVAQAYSEIFKRPVEVKVIPREQWLQNYRKTGFSEVSARSYAEMTRVTLDEAPAPEKTKRGPTTLYEYLAEGVRTQSVNVMV